MSQGESDRGERETGMFFSSAIANGKKIVQLLTQFVDAENSTNFIVLMDFFQFKQRIELKKRPLNDYEREMKIR